jgi:formate/nitrite transporter FocA (FNT family)
MKSQQEIHDDLASIRNIMEKSSKFISLSGLSGILAGVYALAGAALALYFSRTVAVPNYRYGSDYHILRKAPELIWPLGTIAIIVLVASLITGFILSGRQAKKHGTTLWTPATYRVLLNLAIPLVTGGIVIITQIAYGNYEFIAPGCLIFYGLALIAASPNLYEEVRYLGYSQIVLGIVCGFLSGYGLFFWATGFGIFHIFYGALMFRKYDR